MPEGVNARVHWLRRRIALNAIDVAMPEASSEQDVVRAVTGTGEKERDVAITCTQRPPIARQHRRQRSGQSRIAREITIAVDGEGRRRSELELTASGT